MRNFALLFALTLPTIAAFSYFQVFSDPELMAPLYSASKIIQFSIPLLVLFLIQRNRLSFEHLNWPKFIAGNFLGMIFFSLLMATYFFFKDFDFIREAAPLIQEKLFALGATTPFKFLLLAIFISVLHAFLEEYYWRWYVHRELKRFFNFPITLFLTSLAFTSHHVIVIHAYLPDSILHWGIWFFPSFVFVAGLIWSWIYERWRGLWVVWLSHIWADAAIMWIGYLLVWGN